MENISDIGVPLLWNKELIYCSNDKTTYTILGLKQLILQLNGDDCWSSRSPLMDFIDWRKWISTQSNSYIVYNLSKEFNVLKERLAEELSISPLKIFVDGDLSNNIQITIMKKISKINFDYFNNLFKKLATEPVKYTFYLSNVSGDNNATYLNFKVNSDNIEYCFDNYYD